MRFRIRAMLSRRRTLAVTATILIPTASLTALYMVGFRQNLTQSQPPGIYRLTDSPSDPLVCFCPTGNASNVSVDRGYRAESWACPDGHAPLLKPVAARAGDVVTVTHQGISVNGVRLPNTESYAHDAHGNSMNQWPEGTYTVQPGTVWVLSTYNKLSYDSRYFGAISEATIAKHGHLVWAFR
jgi:conjugative transfer signal peptidase TraF